MAVGAQGAAVDPGVGERVHHLLPVAAQHGRRHRGAGHPHQQHVVQPHAVEAVLQRDDALDLVGLDHGRQHVAHGDGAAVSRAPVEVVGHRQDGAQVVRGVPPLGRQEGVVEVEPADHGADVERGLDRVQLPGGAGHPGASGHDRAGHHRPQQPGACRKLQRGQGAAQAVHQAQPRGLPRLVRERAVREGIVGHVGEDRVGLGSLRVAHGRVAHGG